MIGASMQSMGGISTVGESQVRKPTLCFGALLLQGGVYAARCCERANAEETRAERDEEAQIILKHGD